MTIPPLRNGRIHEACGASAHAFACLMARGREGAVLWLRETWQRVELLPEGLSTLLPPEKVTLVTPPSHIDLLAVAEEALKDASVGCVVLEITTPLNLREGRRLQLAAHAGQSLGICLLPNADMGSNAAETRWHCQPLHDAGQPCSTLMHWQLIKNKSATIGAWHVRWDETAHHIDLAAAPSL